MVVPGRRLEGLDVARAVALTFMLVVHFVVPDGGGVVRWLWDLGDGRAMPLFVLLAGTGFVLLTARARHPVAEVLGRAAVLAVIGLVMWDHVPLIAVIPHVYAVLYVAALPVRRLPDAGLLALAVAVTAAGAWSWVALAPDLPTYDGWAGWSTLGDPGPLAADLLVTGSYPFLPTMAFFLVGMWVGRRDLRSPLVLTRLAMAGAVLAGLGYGVGGLVWDRIGVPTEDRPVDWVRLADPSGHSNLPAWVIGATGTSLLVVAACGLAVRSAGRLLAPLAAAGRLSLTAYVVQGAALALWWEPGSGISRRGEWADLVVVVASVAGLSAAASVWLRRHRHGPVEELVRLGGTVATRAVTGDERGAPARPRAG